MKRIVMQCFPSSYEKAEKVFSQHELHPTKRGNSATFICLYRRCLPVISRLGGWYIKQQPHLRPLVGIPRMALLKQFMFDSYDVLLSTDLFSVSTLIGYITTRLRGKKHGVMPREFHYRRESVPGKLSSLAVRYLIRRTDFFIPYTLSSARFLTTTLRVPKEKVYYIPKVCGDRRKLAQDAAQTRQVHESYFSRDKKNLLFVGRLVPMKGLDVLLRALSERTDRFHLVIVGNTQGQYGRYCKRLASELDVDVTFVGQVGTKKGSAEVGHFYRNADLFVVPNKYVPAEFEATDLNPGVIREAQWFGLPIIATTATGNKSELRGTGRVVTESSVQGLREALDDFYLYPHKWKKMGKQGPKVQRELRKINLNSWQRLFQDLEAGRI